MTRRVAFAGFQHETNTFSTTPAGLHEFEMADSWPGLLLGPQVVEETAGMNLPIAGALELARSKGLEIRPILWCAAEPSGPVTDDAFEVITDKIVEGLKSCAPLDGIYLDLHGAMVTESHADGEAAILRKIRAEVGPDLPIAVSLDLHANISAEMVDLASVITIFRSYPHLDMAETGARALQALLEVFDNGAPAHAFRQAPFLVPLPVQFTGADPCRALYESTIARSQNGTAVVLALGFTAADIADCGPSVLAYAETQEEADRQADDMMAEFTHQESAFDTRLLTPEEAIKFALERTGTGPVVFADVEDNPGAGGSSDTTGILAALLKAEISSALVGIICDPDVASQATRAGSGAKINASLGGKAGIGPHRPIEAEWDVLTTSDGHVPYSGQMYGGGVASLGDSALLRIKTSRGEVQTVVSSNRIQCLDLGLFHHFAANPRQFDIVAVKSTVHFRADFDPIARATVNVISPGGFPCDLSAISYKNLRQGVRILS